MIFQVLITSNFSLLKEKKNLPNYIQLGYSKNSQESKFLMTQRTNIMKYSISQVLFFI